MTSCSASFCAASSVSFGQGVCLPSSRAGPQTHVQLFNGLQEDGANDAQHRENHDRNINHLGVAVVALSICFPETSDRLRRRRLIGFERLPRMPFRQPGAMQQTGESVVICVKRRKERDEGMRNLLQDRTSTDPCCMQAKFTAGQQLSSPYSRQVIGC